MRRSSQKKADKGKSQKEKQKPKEPEKEKIKPIEIPTSALLTLQRIREQPHAFERNKQVELNDIPGLMNMFVVPMKKRTPKERLQYLKSMNVKKTERKETKLQLKVKRMKTQLNIVDDYKSDKVKFKILTGMEYDDFFQFVSLLECQMVKFNGDMNVKKCSFQRGSLSNIKPLSYSYRLTVESIVFVFIVYVRTGLNFTKLFCLLDLDRVSPNTTYPGETEAKYIVRNTSRMSKFIERTIQTFLNRYTLKVFRDFIHQVSSCSALNVPLAVGQLQNDIMICPELLYSYRIVDSKTVRSTTNWKVLTDGKGKVIKSKNKDYYSEKVKGSGFKFEIQINRFAFITEVVSTSGNVSDIKIAKLGSIGTFSNGLTLGDGGYHENDFNSLISSLSKTCAKNEEDKEMRDAFNSTFTNVRNLVERVFGTMTKMFGLLHSCYIHDKSLFDSLIICLCGIYNYCLIKGPIKNDLIENNDNNILIQSIDVHKMLKESFTGKKMCCDIFDKLSSDRLQSKSQDSEVTSSANSFSTPSQFFGFQNGINQPFQQMDQVVEYCHMYQQSQPPKETNQSQQKATITKVIDLNIEQKHRDCDIYALCSGIRITKKDMNDLYGRNFISSHIVDAILQETILLKENIYVFEVLYHDFCDILSEEGMHLQFNDASMYSTWICPVCDNNHFTLFVIHLNQGNATFDHSCVLFFNSLENYSCNVDKHLSMIKRIAHSINCSFDGDQFHSIKVPQQNINDCGCCVCFFALKYVENMPKNLQETIKVFSSEGLKESMDKYRSVMIGLINKYKVGEGRKFN